MHLVLKATYDIVSCVTLYLMFGWAHGYSAI